MSSVFNNWQIAYFNGSECSEFCESSNYDDYDLLETSELYSSKHQFQCNWDDSEWHKIDYYGSVNVGNIFTYALDIEDVYEYIGKRYISSSELNEMFFNQSTFYG